MTSSAVCRCFQFHAVDALLVTAHPHRGLSRAMSRALKFALVGLMLIFELLFCVSYNPYPHGAIVDIRYRQKERLAAYNESRLHPSAASQAAFTGELTSMRRYERGVMIVTLSLLLGADALGIYYLFGYGHKKTLA